MPELAVPREELAVLREEVKASDANDTCNGWPWMIPADETRQGPWLASYHVHEHIEIKELEETDKVLNKALQSLESSESEWLLLCCQCINPDDSLELDEENKFLGENGRCGHLCDVCRIRPCMREVDHAGSGPPFGHCLCSLASRGVNCATIKKVEIADVTKHYAEAAVPSEEVAVPREKPSDQPLAITDSSLPSSSSLLEPSEGLSDSSVTDDEASQAGLLLHLMTNRVHVCSDSGAQKTRCGLAFSNDLELKTTQISCSDLKCAKCFRIRKVLLPGRQAA